MDTKKLRQKILDLAIHGKLVPQDPNDEPASVLLERIRAEKELMIKEGKIKRSKKASTSSHTPHYEQVPFEVPEGWVWTTLGNIGTWQAGGTPNRSNKEYYGGNIPWLKTGDLNDSFIISIPESITEEAVSKSSAKLNPKGSVLMAMYGATIGKLGILTFPAATNQACCACIQYDAVVQMYLFYYLMSQRSSFIEKGGGGAQPNISKEIIINTTIPVPPLSEQSRIVSQIDYWFSIIEKIESAKVNLKTCIDQTKNKILTLAIHGKLVPQDPNDEPAIELLKRVNPNFTPCDNAQYGKLPNGWCEISFDDIFNITMGQSPDGCSINQQQGIEFHQGKLMFDNKYLRKSDMFTAKPTKLAKPNSLLLCVRAPVGVVNITQREICIGRGLCSLEPNEAINLDYAYYALTTYQSDLESKSTGSTFKAISSSIIRNEVFALPPIQEQHRVVAKIEVLFAQLDSIAAAL